MPFPGSHALQGGTGAQESATAGGEKPSTRPVMLLLAYVFLEYGRPMILSPFRPALILQIVIAGQLLTNLDKVKSVIRDRYFVLFAVLLAEMTLHVFTASNNYFAFKHLQLMASYLLFSIAFCSILDSQVRLRVFLLGFVTIVGAVSLAILLEVPGYLGGVHLLGDTNDLALAMNVMIPMSFFLGLYYRGLRRYYLWGCMLVFVMTNVAAFSRGGFVGMAVVTFLCWFNTKKKAVSLSLFLIGAVVFFQLVSDDYKKDLKTITEQGAESGTGRDRVELWRLGWKMFLGNPLIGVGPGNMSYHLGEYQYDQFGESHWGRNVTGRTVHSIYVTVIAELGITGVVLWVAMMLNVLRKARSVVRHGMSPDDEGLFFAFAVKGLGLGLVGYMISGIFLSALYYPYFWNISALIAAVFMAQARTNPTPNGQS